MRFAYKAVRTAGAAGAIVSGRLEGADEAAVRARLKDDGLAPIEVRPVGLLDALSARAAERPLRSADVVWFFETLGRLLNRSVQLEAAITTMEELAPSPRAARACAQARDSLRTGVSLADSAERVPGLLDRERAALLRVGEASGRLSHVVQLVAKSLVERRRLKRALVSRLIYPAILVVVAMGAVWFLAWFVLPRFAETLESAGAELPLSTRVTLAAAGHMIWVAPVLALAVTALVLSLPLSRSPALRRRVHAATLRVPLVRSVVWNAQGAIVADAVATLLEGGGDALTALEHAEAATTNEILRERLSAARDDVRQGGDLGTALAERRVFPPMTLAVIRASLSAGELAEGLRQGAQLASEAQDELLSRLMTLMEPAIILGLASVVGWIVYSLVSGMLTINAIGAG